MPQDLRIGTYV